MRKNKQTILGFYFQNCNHEDDLTQLYAPAQGSNQYVLGSSVDWFYATVNSICISNCYNKALLLFHNALYLSGFLLHQ